MCMRFVLKDEALAPALDEPPLRPPPKSSMAPRRPEPPPAVIPRATPINSRPEQRRSFDYSDVPPDLLPPLAPLVVAPETDRPSSGRLRHRRTGSDGNYLTPEQLLASRVQNQNQNQNAFGVGHHQQAGGADVGLPRSNAGRLESLRDEYRLRMNIPGLNPEALNAILNDIEEECWPLEPHPLVQAAVEAMGSDTPTATAPHPHIHIDPSIIDEQMQTHQRHVALFRQYLRVRLESALLLQRKYELTQQLLQQQQRQRTPSGSALVEPPRVLGSGEAPSSLQMGALLAMSPTERRRNLVEQYSTYSIVYVIAL